MVRQITEPQNGREKVFNMNMEESLGVATPVHKRKKNAKSVATNILPAPKPGKETRENLQQICIHGIARQSCFACGGGEENLKKPLARRGARYGI
jgi:hypothetical protein